MKIKYKILRFTIPARKIYTYFKTGKTYKFVLTENEKETIKGKETKIVYNEKGEFFNVFQKIYYDTEIWNKTTINLKGD